MTEAMAAASAITATETTATEVRVKIPNSILSRLREELHLNTNSKVMEEALTMLVWAAEEKRKGRIILSSNRDGKDVTRLAMRSLI